MFLSSFPRVEGAEISSLASFRVLLARIQAVLTGLEFSNHNDTPRWIDKQLNSLKRTTIIAAQLMVNPSVQGVVVVNQPLEYIVI